MNREELKEKTFNEYVCILNKSKQLEKELKQTKLNFKNSQTHSKNCYKKLKEKFERVKEVYHRNYELIQENGKLKQAIKILKDTLGLYLVNKKFDKRIVYALMSKTLGMCLLNPTQEQYKLLKEVLKDD